MFFDQLDERNIMVQSNDAFEELAQTGLAGQVGSSRLSSPEMPFVRLATFGCQHMNPRF